LKIELELLLTGAEPFLSLDKY